MPRCPTCREPLIQVEENQVVAHTCPACRGTWISARALQRRTRIETSPGQPHIPLPPLADLAEIVTRSNSTAPLDCPICTHPMTKAQFHPQIPIQIDRCLPCDHLWLDPGEQALLLRLYAELLATQPAIAASQQLTLDRLQRAQSLPTYTSGPDRLDIALNIGSTILTILLELLLTPSRSHRHRW
jgi:Zn-finger nucleic acid-binding protein